MNKKRKDKIIIIKPREHNIYLHTFRAAIIGLVLIGIGLVIGMCGWHYFEKLSWTDSFLSASMILSGMGPVYPFKTEAGKIFAGCYALFSGLAFIAIVVIMLSPIIHRFFRKIHLEGDKKSSSSDEIQE